MITALIRTLIMYAIIVFSMRIMGKRQLGQMQIGEFITAMILSELAALPITDRNIPLLYGLVPLLTIIVLEVILSFISMKSPKMQRFIESTPTFIMSEGKLDIKALKDSRISLKELLVELRTSGITSLDEAEYVILEPNGKFSIIPKAKARPATNEDIRNVNAAETSPDFSIIVDGNIIEENLYRLGHDRRWLMNKIRPHKAEDIFYFSCDKNGKTVILPVTEKKE